MSGEFWFYCKGEAAQLHHVSVSGAAIHPQAAGRASAVLLQRSKIWMTFVAAQLDSYSGNVC